MKSVKSTKQSDFLKSIMEKKYQDYTDKQKTQLRELQIKAEQYYFQITGENYGINVWYYMARDLQCPIKNDKNKWGRFRFDMPEFDNCDPGNDAYNGLENYKSVVSARKYLLRNYKKKHKLEL